MAKRSAADAQLERLKQIKSNPSVPGAVEELTSALRGESNIIAARAAEIVADAKLAALEPVLVEAFDFFLAHEDKGCVAKTAIAKALLGIESRAEEIWLRGVRHYQQEGSWGRPNDAAIELRCVCAAGLVNMRSRKALAPLVHLLAEVEPRALPGNDGYAQTRIAAIRALAAQGGDAAEALLRFKLLIGDADSAVTGECLTALLALTRSPEVVEAFLDSDDEQLCEAAMLALGESRLPQAYSILRGRWDQQFDVESRRMLALALALTRRPEAIDFLIEQLAQAGPKVAVAVVEALAMYRGDELIRGRIESAARQRGGEIAAEFERRFMSSGRGDD